MIKPVVEAHPTLDGDEIHYCAEFMNRFDGEGERETVEVMEVGGDEDGSDVVEEKKEVKQNVEVKEEKKEVGEKKDQLVLTDEDAKLEGGLDLVWKYGEGELEMIQV